MKINFYAHFFFNTFKYQIIFTGKKGSWFCCLLLVAGFIFCCRESISPEDGDTTPIVPQLNITEPAEDSLLDSNEPLTIHWKGKGLTGNVDIHYRLVDEVNWTEAGSGAESDSIQFNLPKDAGATYLVRVINENSGLKDSIQVNINPEDGDTTPIVPQLNITEPAEESLLDFNEPLTIHWKGKGLTGNVDAQYRLVDEVNWTEAGSGAESDSIQFNLPKNIGATYLVRVLNENSGLKDSIQVKQSSKSHDIYYQFKNNAHYVYGMQEEDYSLGLLQRVRKGTIDFKLENVTKSQDSIHFDAHFKVVFNRLDTNGILIQKIDTFFTQKYAMEIDAHLPFRNFNSIHNINRSGIPIQIFFFTNQVITKIEGCLDLVQPFVNRPKCESQNVSISDTTYQGQAVQKLHAIYLTRFGTPHSGFDHNDFDRILIPEIGLIYSKNFRGGIGGYYTKSTLSLISHTIDP